MGDWAALPYDLLLSIADNIKLIEDFVIFGSVCKSWREITRNNKQSLRPQIPWLMLPENKEDAGPQLIYSLSKEKLLTKNLYMPQLSDKWCVGLNHGWVLTISPMGKEEMSLVHPIARSQIELPPQTSIYEYIEDRWFPHSHFISKAALSANPSKTSKFVLMIVHGIGGKYLSYWRRGDKQWNMAKDQGSFRYGHIDLIYYKDQFLTTTYGGEVWRCKLDDDDNYRCSLAVQLVGLNALYMVESGDALLVMVQDEEVDEEQNDYGGFGTRVASWLVSFQVYELNLIKGGCKRIKNLGDRAIFMGREHNTSISLDNVSQFPGVKSNHIYFTDVGERSVDVFMHHAEGAGTGMGSYDLEGDQEARVKVKLRETQSLPLICRPPFWFIPSLL